MTSFAALALTACGPALPDGMAWMEDGPQVIEAKRKSSARLEALTIGQLDLTGNCVSLGDGMGGSVIIFEPDAARMAVRDGEPVLVTEDHVFEHGDRVQSGGAFVGDAGVGNWRNHFNVPNNCHDSLVVMYELIPADRPLR